MALTPEDVVKKEFTKPKGFGRSGYDEIQVDDFLDEIVVELRRLNTENQDLTLQLEECRRSKPGSKAAGDQDQTADVPAPRSHAVAVPALTPVAAGGADADDKAEASGSDADPAQLTRLESDISAAEKRLEELRDEVNKAEEATRAAQQAQAEAESEADKARQQLGDLQDEVARLEGEERDATQRLAAVPSEDVEAADAPADDAADQEAPALASEADVSEAPTAAQSLVAAGGDGAVSADAVGGSTDASSLIALAQRVHDEHVRDGQTQRAQLISEGEAHHDRVVGEATATRDELISTGQARHDELISTGQARHDELISTGQARHDELVTTGQTQHDSLISEATDRSATLVGDAEGQRTQILGELNTERDRLTSDIDQLRTFERDYRTKLKGYIQVQLKQLDNTAIDTEALDSKDGEESNAPVK